MKPHKHNNEGGTEDALTYADGLLRAAEMARAMAEDTTSYSGTRQLERLVAELEAEAAKSNAIGITKGEIK